MSETYPLYHVGVEGCGKVAFYTTRRLIAGEDSIIAADVVLLDGSHPVDMVYEMVCGSCHNAIDLSELTYTPPLL